MSRIVVAVILSLWAVSSPQAKLYEGAGVVVGAGFSSLNTSLESYYHKRLGPQAGVMVDLASSYQRAEVQYLQRGQYIETDVVNEQGEFLGRYRDDMWADYLTMPVMARFTPDLRPADLFVTAGPRMDILLDYTQSTGSCPFLRKSHFQPINIGANWGIGATSACTMSRLSLRCACHIPSMTRIGHKRCRCTHRQLRRSWASGSSSAGWRGEAGLHVGPCRADVRTSALPSAQAVTRLRREL